MPRANRYLLPGQIAHLTHRCHNREFLLRFRNLSGRAYFEATATAIDHEVQYLSGLALQAAVGEFGSIEEDFPAGLRGFSK
jgi:putative transposase